jgi:hypothetical protein
MLSVTQFGRREKMILQIAGAELVGLRLMQDDRVEQPGIGPLDRRVTSLFA